MTYPLVVVVAYLLTRVLAWKSLSLKMSSFESFQIHVTRLSHTYATVINRGLL